MVEKVGGTVVLVLMLAEVRSYFRRLEVSRAILWKLRCDLLLDIYFSTFGSARRW